MSNQSEESAQILFEFLERWPVDRVRSMTLEEYVSVGDKDTFCYWLETKTEHLGGIKGQPSGKFGIYKRKNRNKRPKNLMSESEYSWQRKLGETKEDAFENIKKEVISIIVYSSIGHFDRIEDLELNSLVRWKIAYLYSNERLVPIFKKSVLRDIAGYFGLDDKNAKIAAIQELIIGKKPAHLSIHEFAAGLFSQFSGRNEPENGRLKGKRLTKRKPGGARTITRQKRAGSRSYIANQNHNKLQTKLRSDLIERYGEQNVEMEENYVDVKVSFSEELHFYEVKSASFASDCVREALGQLLAYVYHDCDERGKKLFVVGQYEPNDDELGYIDFVKQLLNIEFDYIAIGLDGN